MLRQTLGFLLARFLLYHYNWCIFPNFPYLWPITGGTIIDIMINIVIVFIGYYFKA